MMTEAEIQKIKDEATQKAIEILESKYNPNDLRTEGYNEAIATAQKYFILCGSRVLHDVFGFGYKRLDRFISHVANLEIDTEDGTTSLDELEKWLDERIGMKLVGIDVEEELEKRQEAKNGGN